MSSPLSLFSPQGPVATAASGATLGAATGSAAAGTTPLGLTATQSEGLPAEGDFLTSFVQLMQTNISTDMALQNPLQLEDGKGVVADSAAVLIFEIAEDPQLEGLLGELTAAENPLDILAVDASVAEAALDTGWAIPLVGPTEETTNFNLHANLVAEVPPSEITDGIPAAELVLPAIAAQDVINTAPTELVIESESENPMFVLNGTSQPQTPIAVAITAPEQTASKRLDLTQWLSGANLSTEADAAESTFTASTSPPLTEGLPIKENTDALLKNALFARALPKTEGLARLETEWNPPTLSETTAKPLTGSAPAPWVADITNTGRISVPLSLSFGHPQWSEALAERAGWLAHQRIQSADMQLDPPELGPLQVKISMHQDQVVVSFVSANPQVRDLLDQNVVRLRELLQEQGMQLMDAGVSDHQRQSDESARALAGDAIPAADDGASITANAGEAQQQVNLAWGVDDFV